MWLEQNFLKWALCDKALSELSAGLDHVSRVETRRLLAFLFAFEKIISEFLPFFFGLVSRRAFTETSEAVGRGFGSGPLSPFVTDLLPSCYRVIISFSFFFGGGGRTIRHRPKIVTYSSFRSSFLFRIYFFLGMGDNECVTSTATVMRFCCCCCCCF